MLNRHWEKGARPIVKTIDKQTGTHTYTYTYTDRHRKAGRQTDIQTHRQAHTHKHTYAHTHTHTHRKAGIGRHRYTSTRAHRQPERQEDPKTGRQAVRQTQNTDKEFELEATDLGRSRLLGDLNYFTVFSADQNLILKRVKASSINMTSFLPFSYTF